MIENHIYDLMNQLTQEHKSLWRIKNEYMKNSDGHLDCIEMWEKLASAKEEHVEELSSLLKKYLK